jgi:hypothetical protein
MNNKESVFKKYIFLILSCVGVVYFSLMLVATSCNIGGGQNLRGDKAEIMALVMALPGALSFVTLLFQAGKLWPKCFR